MVEGFKLHESRLPDDHLTAIRRLGLKVGYTREKLKDNFAKAWCARSIHYALSAYTFLVGAEKDGLVPKEAPIVPEDIESFFEEHMDSSHGTDQISQFQRGFIELEPSRSLADRTRKTVGLPPLTDEEWEKVKESQAAGQAREQSEAFLRSVKEKIPGKHDISNFRSAISFLKAHRAAFNQQYKEGTLNVLIESLQDGIDAVNG